MNKEIHNVISQKEGRIALVEKDKWVVRKRTSYAEAMQLALMQSIARDANIGTIEWQNDVYSVDVPQFISWEEETGILEMEYCEGDNLEIILKNATQNDRLQYVELSASVISWMKQNGILWRDAAPRNTLINHASRKIVLLDFERPLLLKSGRFEDSEFNLLVRGNITEEFNAFLFEPEQESVFPRVWEGNEDVVIDKKSILSGRQIILLEHLYGKQDNEVKAVELAHAQQMMSNTVTPFYLDGEPFFPLIYLEKCATAGEYIDKVIELQNIPKQLWKEILKN